jgi:hypothetical protein
MLVTLRAARGHARVKSRRPSSQTPAAPRSLRRPGKTSSSQRCSYATYLSLQTLNSRSSTATSGRWWSVPPCSGWNAPRHATSMWLSRQEGWGRLAAAKPLSPPAARVSTLGGSRHRGYAALRPGARLAAPRGAWPARAQI